MSLSKELKDKVLGATVTPTFHKEVVDFVNARGWRLSAFIRQAIQESMDKVVKNEKRGK